MFFLYGVELMSVKIQKFEEGMIISGVYYRYDELACLELDNKIGLMCEWFSENHSMVKIGSNTYRFRKSHEVNPLLVIGEVFSDAIDADSISLAAESVIKSDHIWCAGSESSIWGFYVQSEPDPYPNFQTSIEHIQAILEHSYNLARGAVQHQLFHILYSNIFTTFESYISAAFIHKLFSSNDALHHFLTKQKEFGISQPKMTDLLCDEEHIGELIEEMKAKLKTDLTKTSWHDLEKVARRFSQIGIKVPFSKSGLNKIIDTRNDIVHRNGRTAGGDSVVVMRDQIESAINTVRMLAEHIHNASTIQYEEPEYPYE